MTGKKDEEMYTYTWLGLVDYQLPANGTLSEAVKLCADLDLRVELRDAAGFLKFRVNADGHRAA